MKKSTFDTDGFPTGHYDTRVHKTIPPEAIEITNDEWLALVDNTAIYDHMAKRIIPYTPPAIPAPTFDQLRQRDILDAWPIHRQLEAITEKEAGRPELMNMLLSDIATIKTKHPKPIV